MSLKTASNNNIATFVAHQIIKTKCTQTCMYFYLPFKLTVRLCLCLKYFVMYFFIGAHTDSLHVRTYLHTSSLVLVGYLHFIHFIYIDNLCSIPLSLLSYNIKRLRNAISLLYYLLDARLNVCCSYMLHKNNYLDIKRGANSSVYYKVYCS